MRFDDHVSFIAPHSYGDQEVEREVSGRIRRGWSDSRCKKELSDETSIFGKSGDDSSVTDDEASVTGSMKTEPTSITVVIEREKGLASNSNSKQSATAALRNVFFHSSTSENKRLSKIRKSPVSLSEYTSSPDLDSSRQTAALPVIPEPMFDQPLTGAQLDRIDIPAIDSS